jgi:Ca-activated chloride channel family protein
MTLLAPSRLWLLALVAVAAVAYAVVQGRRRPAVRHPGLDLVRAAAPRSAAWRRHLTTGTLLLAVAGLAVGLARPAHAAEVPRSDAVIMLALDTSRSMAATDVAPSRFEAALSAAKDFAADAPAGYRIGLVTFSATAQVAVPPTTDRVALSDALDAIELDGGTAAGDAVTTALDALDAVDSGTVIRGDQPYQAIVLLSDGTTTDGASLDDAATTAADADVPVYTVSLGTAAGTVPSGTATIAVPADPDAMAALADATDGSTYTASTAGGLEQVYDRIASAISTVTEQVELTVPVAAAAALVLTAAFVMSLAWSPRLA